MVAIVIVGGWAFAVVIHGEGCRAISIQHAPVNVLCDCHPEVPLRAPAECLSSTAVVAC